VKKVFISYRSTERQPVEKLVAAVEQAGDFDVWYDQEIIGGQSWWDEILKALEGADIVVLALSRAYLDSEACRLELDYALRLGKAIVPVRIDPGLEVSRLGAQLVTKQIINFPAENATALVSALNAAQPAAAAANKKRPEAPISPLAEIRDLIAAPGELPTATQQRIVDALRWHLRRQPTDSAQVHDLLAQLNRRPEVARQVSDEIATILGSSATAAEAAPKPSRPGVLRRLNEPWAMIAAALITAAATIAAVVIAANLNTPASNSAPTATTSAPTTQQSVNTPPPAEPGPFDVTLIYGARDSFTIVLNEESHLAELVMETPALAETISSSFVSLAATGFVGDEGVCLRYIREDTQPATPRGCTTIFEHSLPAADIFWFDDRLNQFQDIAFKQSGELVGLCPNAGGSGRCDFKKD
jgi:hypothetical protein